MAFNINAQIILSQPKNLNNVAKSISKQLGKSAKIDLKIGNVQQLTTLNKQLTTLNNSLTKLNSGLSSTRGSVSALGNSFNNTSRGVANAAKAQGTLATQVTRANQSLKAQGGLVGTLGKRFGSVAKQAVAFGLISRPIYDLQRALTVSVKDAVKFEREIVRIGQVTGKTVSQLDGLTSQINSLSTALGLSANELAETSRVIAQAGIRGKDLEQVLTALARSTLAPTFGKITDTTEGLIAAFGQFGLKGKDAEAVLGSLNKVSKEFAVEAEDLISVIRRTGGVFAQAAGDTKGTIGALQELTAVFTAVRSSTRESADTIAAGLRTIFSRIQRRSTINFLKQFGVDLVDTQGKFVGIFPAFDQLSKRLDTLIKQGDALTLSAIAEELGGIRQIGKLLPAIAQFDKARKALTQAQQGAVEGLGGDVAKALDTIDNRVKRVRETFKQLIRTVFESDAFQNFSKNILKSAETFLSFANDLSKALEPILPLLSTIGAFKIGAGISGLLRGGVGGAVSGAVAGATGSTATAQAAQKTAAATVSQNSLIGTTNSTLVQMSRQLANLIQINNSGFNQANKTLGTISSRSPSPSVGGRRRAGGGFIPKFANGGRVYGPSHAGGGVIAELEGGEYVVPKKYARGTPKGGVQGGKGKKNAYVFDFDDTLATTAAKGFKDFNDPSFIRSAQATRYSSLAKRRARRGDDIHVLTARFGSQGIIKAIQNFMTEIGAPAKSVIAVGGAFKNEREPGKRPGTTRKIGTATKKAKILTNLAKRYNEITFLDDNLENIVKASEVKGVRPVTAEAGKLFGKGAASPLRRAAGGLIPRFAIGGTLDIQSTIGQLVSKGGSGSQTSRRKSVKARDLKSKSPTLKRQLSGVSSKDDVIVSPTRVPTFALDQKFAGSKFINSVATPINDAIRSQVASAGLPSGGNKVSSIKNDPKARQILEGFAFERFAGAILGLSPGGGTSPFDFKGKSGKLQSFTTPDPISEFVDAKRTQVSAAQIVNKALREPGVKFGLTLPKGRGGKGRRRGAAAGGFIQKLATGDIVRANSVGVAILDPDDAPDGSAKVGVKDIENQIGFTKGTARGFSGVGAALKQNNFTGSYKIIKQGLNKQTSDRFNKLLAEGLIKGVDFAASGISGDLGLGPTTIDQASKTKFIQSQRSAIRGDLFEAALSSLNNRGKFDNAVDFARPFDFPDGLRGPFADNFSKLPSKFVDAKSSVAAAPDSNIRGKIIREIAADVVKTDPNILAQKNKQTGGKASKKSPKQARGFGALTFASGGEVPVRISNGEMVVTDPKEVAANSGSLKKINKLAAGGFASGYVAKGPGTGTSDSIYTTLPAGAFVVNAKSTKKFLGRAAGGSIPRFAGGTKGAGIGDLASRIKFTPGTQDARGPFVQLAKGAEQFTRAQKQAEDASKKLAVVHNRAAIASNREAVSSLRAADADDKEALSSIRASKTGSKGPSDTLLNRQLSNLISINNNGFDQIRQLLVKLVAGGGIRGTGGGGGAPLGLIPTGRYQGKDPDRRARARDRLNRAKSRGFGNFGRGPSAGGGGIDLLGLTFALSTLTNTLGDADSATNQLINSVTTAAILFGTLGSTLQGFGGPSGILAKITASAGGGIGGAALGAAGFGAAGVAIGTVVGNILAPKISDALVGAAEKIEGTNIRGDKNLSDARARSQLEGATKTGLSGAGLGAGIGFAVGGGPFGAAIGAAIGGAAGAFIGAEFGKFNAQFEQAVFQAAKTFKEGEKSLNKSFENLEKEFSVGGLDKIVSGLEQQRGNFDASVQAFNDKFNEELTIAGQALDFSKAVVGEQYFVELDKIFGTSLSAARASQKNQLKAIKEAGQLLDPAQLDKVKQALSSGLQNFFENADDATLERFADSSQSAAEALQDAADAGNNLAKSLVKLLDEQARQLLIAQQQVLLNQGTTAGEAGAQGLAAAIADPSILRNQEKYADLIVDINQAIDATATEATYFERIFSDVDGNVGRAANATTAYLDTLRNQQEETLRAEQKAADFSRALKEVGDGIDKTIADLKNITSELAFTAKNSTDALSRLKANIEATFAGTGQFQTAGLTNAFGVSGDVAAGERERLFQALDTNFGEGSSAGARTLAKIEQVLPATLEKLSDDISKGRFTPDEGGPLTGTAIFEELSSRLADQGLEAGALGGLRELITGEGASRQGVESIKPEEVLKQLVGEGELADELGKFFDTARESGESLVNAFNELRKQTDLRIAIELKQIEAIRATEKSLTELSIASQKREQQILSGRLTSRPDQVTSAEANVRARATAIAGTGDSTALLAARDEALRKQVELNQQADALLISEEERRKKQVELTNTIKTTTEALDLLSKETETYTAIVNKAQKIGQNIGALEGGIKKTLDALVAGDQGAIRELASQQQAIAAAFNQVANLPQALTAISALGSEENRALVDASAGRAGAGEDLRRLLIRQVGGAAAASGTLGGRVIANYLQGIAQSSIQQDELLKKAEQKEAEQAKIQKQIRNQNRRTANALEKIATDGIKIEAGEEGASPEERLTGSITSLETVLGEKIQEFNQIVANFTTKETPEIPNPLPVNLPEKWDNYFNQLIDAVKDLAPDDRNKFIDEAIRAEESPLRQQLEANRAAGEAARGNVSGFTQLERIITASESVEASKIPSGRSFDILNTEGKIDTDELQRYLTEIEKTPEKFKELEKAVKDFNTTVDQNRNQLANPKGSTELRVPFVDALAQLYFGAPLNRDETAAGGATFRAKGGSIFQPRGTDTVPAMLTPGEFVIKKSSVDQYGPGVMQAINQGQAQVFAASGGRVGKGVLYRANGGGTDGDDLGDIEKRTTPDFDSFKGTSLKDVPSDVGIDVAKVNEQIGNLDKQLNALKAIQDLKTDIRTTEIRTTADKTLSPAERELFRTGDERFTTGVKVTFDNIDEIPFSVRERGNIIELLNQGQQVTVSQTEFKRLKALKAERDQAIDLGGIGLDERTAAGDEKYVELGEELFDSWARTLSKVEFKEQLDLRDIMARWRANNDILAGKLGFDLKTQGTQSYFWQVEAFQRELEKFREERKITDDFYGDESDDWKDFYSLSARPIKTYLAFGGEKAKRERQAGNVEDTGRADLGTIIRGTEGVGALPSEISPDSDLFQLLSPSDQQRVLDAQGTKPTVATPAAEATVATDTAAAPAAAPAAGGLSQEQIEYLKSLGIDNPNPVNVIPADETPEQAKARRARQEQERLDAVSARVRANTAAGRQAKQRDLGEASQRVAENRAKAITKREADAKDRAERRQAALDRRATQEAEAANERRARDEQRASNRAAIDSLPPEQRAQAYRAANEARRKKNDKISREARERGSENLAQSDLAESRRQAARADAIDPRDKFNAYQRFVSAFNVAYGSGDLGKAKRITDIYLNGPYPTSEEGDSIRQRANTLFETVGGNRFQYRRKGGMIRGFAEGGEVPIMAQTGEFVMNRNAVSRLGIGTLTRMNQGLPTFHKGGPVYKQFGGRILGGRGSGSSGSPQTAVVINGADAAKELNNAIITGGETVKQSWQTLFDTVSEGLNTALSQVSTIPNQINATIAPVQIEGVNSFSEALASQIVPKIIEQIAPLIQTNTEQPPSQGSMGV